MIIIICNIYIAFLKTSSKSVADFSACMRLCSVTKNSRQLLRDENRERFATEHLQGVICASRKKYVWTNFLWFINILIQHIMITQSDEASQFFFSCIAAEQMYIMLNLKLLHTFSVEKIYPLHYQKVILYQDTSNVDKSF